MRGLVLAWLACAASFSPPRRRPRRVARAMAVVEKSDAECTEETLPKRVEVFVSL